MCAGAPTFCSPRSGGPEMVKGNWIKPGATVIDVGINRVPGEAGKTRLVGDVDLQGSAGGRRRGDAGAGRRRADDHRLRHSQYAARGLRFRGIAGTEDLAEPFSSVTATDQQAGSEEGR